MDNVINNSLSRYWSLGDDDDCETCGMSYNEIDFSDYEDGEYKISTRLYCYGGQEYTFENIDQLFLDIADFEEYNEDMKQEILAHIDEFKVRYANSYSNLH
jgi:hypothetical protein